MAFKKKSAIVTTTQASRPNHQGYIGVKPSPLDGRLTTSTGTASLDSLLAGHGGLPLGSSLLVGEDGTTDFSGILLRYYAAEGLVQSHTVHVVGPNETWKNEVPGLVFAKAPDSGIPESTKVDKKLKIAWRYGALGNAAIQESGNSAASLATSSQTPVFCHEFDLSKKMQPTAVQGPIYFYPVVASLKPPLGTLGNRLNSSLKEILSRIQESAPSTIHRIVVPGLLSPGLYTPGSCEPGEVINFLQSLRAILRLCPGQVTACVSTPLSLYPRSSGLTRWMEHLCDGVVQIVPFTGTSFRKTSHYGEGRKDKLGNTSQGLLRIHSLPVHTEKGCGGAIRNVAFYGDLEFALSSSEGLKIQALSLPPLQGEEDGPHRNNNQTHGTNEF